MNETNIISSLNIPSQLPLDFKQYRKSKVELLSLGLNNFLAYHYYKGMIIYCADDEEAYEWKEIVVGLTGLLTQNFTYPNNYSANNINYSLKQYNFFLKKYQSQNSRIIPFGEKLIFKTQGNLDNNNLETLDTVVGIIEGNFLNGGTYYGGNPLLIASYIEPVTNLQNRSFDSSFDSSFG